MLVALVEGQGRVVDRAELQSRLWPESHHVDVDAGLNAAVRRARQVLDDSASNPRFIETVPKRGYRFIAPVRVDPVSSPARSDSKENRVPPTPQTPAWSPAPDGSGGVPPTPQTLADIDSDEVPPTPLKRPLARILAAVALAIFLVIIVFFELWKAGPHKPEPDLKNRAFSLPKIPAAEPLSAPPESVRLAVLPLELRTLAPELGQDDKAAPSFFADALVDEIILVLGRLDPLRMQVISRSSLETIHDRPLDLEDIRRHLGVTHVLEGTLYVEGDQARLLIAVVDARSRSRLADATFDGLVASLLSLRLDIAEQVAEALALELVPSTEELLSGQAQRSYLEARHFLSQLTPDGLDRAVASFQQVIDLAPEKAHGYSGSAEAWSLAAVLDFAPPLEAFARAAAYADRALVLDPDFGPAFLAQALTDHLYRWDLDKAGRWYEAALQKNPGSPAVLLFSAAYYSNIGDQERALALARRAVAVDPLSATTHTGLCRRLFVARRSEAAEESCRRAIELAPSYLEAWDNLKWIHIRYRDEAEAIAAFLKVVELEQTHREAVPELRRLAQVDGLDGLLRISVASAEPRLKERGQSPFNLVLDYAALGESDAAVDWLQRAFDAHETDLVSLATDPRLDPLRDDPRFQDVVEAVNAFSKPLPTQPPTVRNPPD